LRSGLCPAGKERHGNFRTSGGGLDFRFPIILQSMVNFLDHGFHGSKFERKACQMV